ncbi:MAG: class I SAM-dependent methyltransferase [Acidobacteria bacterium]|nr:class I SAM-dependent methyltransferase [Acidobacteriota bacterium]
MKTRTSLPQDITDDFRSGRVLAGDDLRGEALARWYAQEKEAYFEEGADSGVTDPWYAYMRYVNDRLVFHHVAQRAPGTILFLGAADGIEAADFHRRHPEWRLAFIESSDSFRAALTQRFPGAEVREPSLDGRMPFADGSVDVVCAFSVLHHIANVTDVLRETARILSPGGAFFVREPCSSMGDWRRARSATPNERGISREWMLTSARAVGLQVASRPVPVVFEPINKMLVRTIGYRVIPQPLLYVVDRFISSALAFNDHYWRDTPLKKLGPSSYLFTFQK